MSCRLHRVLIRQVRLVVCAGRSFGVPAVGGSRVPPQSVRWRIAAPILHIAVRTLLEMESNPGLLRHPCAPFMGGRPRPNAHPRFAKLVLLVMSLLSILNTAVTEENRQTYVVRYKKGDHMIPVTVVLDYKKQTEYVMNMHPRSAAKSVTFYDFKERVITYKDLENKECFIGRLTHETLREESTILENIKNPVEDKPLVLSLEPDRPSLTPTEVKNIAGHKTALFCRRMNTWMLQSNGDHKRSKRQTGELVRRTYSHHGHSTHRHSYHGHESYERRHTPTRSLSINRKSRNDDVPLRTRYIGRPTESQSKLVNHELTFPKQIQHNLEDSSAPRRTDAEKNLRSLRGRWSKNRREEISTHFRVTPDPLQGVVHSESYRSPHRDEASVVSRKTSYQTDPSTHKQRVDLSTDNTDQEFDDHPLVELPRHRGFVDLSTTEKPLSFSSSLNSGISTISGNSAAHLVTYGNNSNTNSKTLSTGWSSPESTILDNTGHLDISNTHNTSSPLLLPQRWAFEHPYIDSDHIDVHESSALNSDSLVVPHQPVIPHWYSTIAKEISIPLDLSFPPYKERLEPHAGTFTEQDNYTESYKFETSGTTDSRTEDSPLENLLQRSGSEQIPFKNSEFRSSATSIYDHSNKKDQSALEIPNSYVRSNQGYLAFEVGPNKKDLSLPETYDQGNTTDHHAFQHGGFDAGNVKSKYVFNRFQNGEKEESSLVGKINISAPSDLPKTHNLIYRNHNVIASYDKPPQVKFSLNTNLSNSFTESPLETVTNGKSIYLFSKYNGSVSHSYPYTEQKVIHSVANFSSGITSLGSMPGISTTSPTLRNRDEHSFVVPNVTVNEGVPRRPERLPNVLQLFTPYETIVDVGKSSNHGGRHKLIGSSEASTKRKFYRNRNKTRGPFTTKKSHIGKSNTAYEAQYRTRGDQSRVRKGLRLGTLRSGLAAYDYQSLDALPPGVSVHPRHPQAPYAELASESAKRTMIANSLQRRVDNQMKHRQRHHRKRDRNLHSVTNGEAVSCCRNGRGCCTGRRRSQQQSCCQETNLHRNLVHLQQDRGVERKSEVKDAEDRCLKEKMCRTVYQSTKQVLVCRNVDIAGC